MCNSSKNHLRERILTLLRNQKEDQRLIKSLAICDKLTQLPEFRSAQTVLFYASFDGEVETFDMMKKAQAQGKMIGLPGINKRDKQIEPRPVATLEAGLEVGPYGIKQPKADASKKLDERSLDMVIVPGVAFDRQNHRLGRGGGYYDKFLAKLPKDTPKIGLAFDFQIVDSLSFLEEHDVPVSRVLTN